MKKPWVIVAILAAVFVAVLILFRDKATAPTTSTNNTVTPSPQSPAVSSGSSKYIDYDEASIANNPGQKVLFFHAKWCPQCRQIESDILAGPLPEGWTIIKVDYDNSQDLRRKYGVTLQTTFVKVDDNGNSLGKFVAYDDPQLSAVTQNFLKK